MENNQNHIEDIFRDAFANHEMEVSAKVWAGVQSTMAAQTAATTSATSAAVFKAAAVIGLTTVVAVGAVNEIQLQSTDSKENEIVLVEDQPMSAQPEDEIAKVDAEAWVETKSIPVEVEPIATNSAEEQVEDIIAQEPMSESNPVVEVETELAENSEAPETKDSAPESKVENNAHSIDNTESQSQEPSNEKSDSDPKPEPKKVEDNSDEAPSNENEEKVCSIEMNHKGMSFISPDGDGTNECFSVEGADQAESFHITIWSKDGVELFETSDPNFTWCGTDRFGNVVSNRTMCYFKIDAFDANGVQYTRSNARGSIQIFR